jgi:protein-S-isoprenylcysteine O-methyltransferase Ste14
MWPVVTVIHQPWNALGIIPFVVGFGLNLVGDRAFKRCKTTVKPFEESTTLVTSGVFRMSRNPMYFGSGLILSGIAILMGSLTPYGVIIIFMILIDNVFIKAEELMLEEKFGQAWLEYKRKVRRWI